MGRLSGRPGLSLALAGREGTVKWGGSELCGGSLRPLLGTRRTLVPLDPYPTPSPPPSGSTLCARAGVETLVASTRTRTRTSLSWAMSCVFACPVCHTQRNQNENVRNHAAHVPIQREGERGRARVNTHLSLQIPFSTAQPSIKRGREAGRGSDGGNERVRGYRGINRIACCIFWAQHASYG